MITMPPSRGPRPRRQHALRWLAIVAVAAAVAVVALCPGGTILPVSATPTRLRTEFPPAAPTPPRAFNPVPICAITGQPSAGSHIGVFDCDHQEDDAQLFVWKSDSTIALSSNSQLCLAVGKDKDPDSGTPALELQACDAGSAQVFAYNSTNQHLVHRATGQCLDLDETDMRVELYSCNDPASPNQQWLPPTTVGTSAEIQLASSKGQQCISACNAVTAGSLGDITKVSQDAHTGEVVIEAGDAAVAVRFYRPDIVRVTMSPEANFADPTHGEMILGADFSFPIPTVNPGTSESDMLQHSSVSWYDIESSALRLRAYQSPLRMELYDAVSGALLWSESQPLTWNTSSTWQTLTNAKSSSSSSSSSSSQGSPSSANSPSAAKKEYFYGCGMQNGNFSHADSVVLIEQGGGWDNGGRPNPAPFYMSSFGYGVFRNTYAVGLYTFLDATILRHDENRFDAFYFHGPSLKKILEGYTAVSGRPFMPPIWGLQLGDSDCYNRQPRNTSDILSVANNYTANAMPTGWFIPNDGYGCGYTELTEVSEALRVRGFQMALWTSTGLGNATWEIGTAGSRGIKTDVGWVGAGYRFALNAVKLATSLLETYGDGRRYIWTVCGWASTHAMAVMWNGDNYGTWEYIRFQIPTVIGSGLSAQVHTSGDVDGIFGGSPDTYVRDLQWKTFLTVAMTMSGWAAVGKQPWTYGEPYTTYNRNSLNLKMRLTPYLYTYSRLANLTGTPIARALVLEYPDDPVTWDNTTQYQFMCGEWLLVAPVYENATTRSNIYLPDDEWIDFSTFNRRVGPATLMNYDAPLWKIPVFVRAGAIIPLWPVMGHVFEKLPDPLTLLLYPSNTPGANTSFTLYEDDGISRNFNAEHSLQTFTLSPVDRRTIVVTASPSVGTYVGKLSSRSFELVVAVPPATATTTAVTLNSKPLPQVHTQQDYEAASQAWWLDQSSNVCSIKTGPLGTENGFTVVVN